MANAVFTSKPEPTYDDLPGHHYHFPKTYLKQVESALGDWVLFYEPRRSNGDTASRGGRQAYVAAARTTQIAADPGMADHYYVYLDQSTYLEFDTPVPFKDGEHYYESLLQKDDGSTNKGAFGRAVRNIPSHEFELILQAGFVTTISDNSPITTTDAGTISKRVVPALEEEGSVFQRPMIEQIVTRPFRDRAFAKGVVTAYEKTCAVTGLSIINGGGRPEVQAAHIQGVADGGSDSVRNGVALSGTVHWMFDRGLISFDDDYSILVARGRLPDAAEKLIREERKLLLPAREDLRPHRVYLKHHRERVFKG